MNNYGGARPIRKDELPDEWLITRLGDVCNFKSGEGVDYSEDDEARYKVFGANGPKGWAEKSNIDSGLVIGTVGSVGTVKWIREPAWVAHNATRGFVAEGTNTGFLFYLLNHKDLAALAMRTAQPFLSQSVLKAVSTTLPPLEEQRKIASVLYTVDELLKNTENIISCARTLRSGLRNRFVQRGLRDDSDVKQVRFGPVLAEVPADWDRLKLENVYTERRLGTTERGNSGGGSEIPLVKMGNLNVGSWDFTEVEYIGRDEELVANLKLQPGDLLFNTRNTPGLVGKTAVWELDKTAIYDNNLLRLRFDETQVLPRYVNHYLSSSVGRRQLRSRVHGTTSVAAVYWKDLKQVEIPVPPITVQRRMVNVLGAVNEVIEIKADFYRELRKLKTGLMQDLLSGKVRTDDLELEVPEEVAAYG